MTVKRDPSTFKVPLTNAFHQAAQAFYSHHVQPQKRKQVYLNTLSVQAAQFYLQCLGIDTCLDKSESWHPISQVLADIADLWVNDLGRLECRPVLPAAALKIPPEVSADRIGYLFVQFDANLTEATLLGFLSSMRKGAIPLSTLQSLEVFPVYLGQLREDTLHSKESLPWASCVRLQQWLARTTDASWTSLETLIAGWQKQNLAFSFRTPLAKTNLIETAALGLKKGKFLTVDETTSDPVLFIVGIAPVPDSAAFNITVELYPTGSQIYLPSALQLRVMDEDSTPVLQAEGRQSEGLEFQFSGSPGERFSVQITLNQLTLTELFEI